MAQCKTVTNIAFRLEDTDIEHHVVTTLLSIQSRQPSSWPVDWMMKANRLPSCLKFIPSDCFVGISQTQNLPIKTNNSLRNKTRNRYTFASVSCRIVCKNEIRHLKITHDL